MHDSTRALLKRGSVVAATAAMLLGSSFTALPAMAASSDAAEPTATETSAPTGADAPPDPGHAPLPGGLKEAVERDLGITVEEFYKNGELNAVVDSLAKELKQSSLEADFEISENKINVTVAASSLQAVTKKLAELTAGTGVELGIEAAPATAAPSVPASDRAPESSDTDPDASEPQVTESPKSEAAPEPKAPRVEAKGLPSNVDTLLVAYLNSVEPAAASGLQSVMKNMDGSFVIRTGGAAHVEQREAASARSGEILQPTEINSQKLTPEEFAGQYTKVTIEAAEGPASPAAANDVLGGMAYGALVGEVGNERLALCSVGFSGFNPKGAPAAISAGHCAQDGDVSAVRIIEQAAPNIPIALGADLGTFGFSQFGGPGNSPVTGWYAAETIDDLGNIGTDISVIDKINGNLDLEALVTDWKGVDERDSGTKVTGVASAVLGANICKSGRTTGWTCGKVDEVGVFVVGGPKGEDDIRAVRGFGIENHFKMVPDPFNPGAQIEDFEKADRGDSGGSVLAGGTAVGITSAVSTSEGGRAYFTDVKDALKHAKGYTIELSLKAPTVTSPSKGADVAAGATISGTAPGAPSGSSVVVRSGGKKIATVKVASGKFSFKAPAVLGTFDFTLQTVNGYSTSVATAGSVNILVGTPVIKTPANGKSFTEVQSVVSGTGVPGATIKLTGALTTDVLVGSNGRWNVELEDGLSYGPHSITAVQTLRDVTSSSVKSGFKVVPVAPSIDSLTEGQEFASGKAPKTLSGFGINGSTIRVSIGDARLTAVVANGAWTVLVPENLHAGDHNVSAVQVIDEVASAATSITFRIAEAAKQPPTRAPEPSKAPVVPQGSFNGDDSDGLANTGANDALPFVATGGALMIAGGLLMLFRRKNTTRQHGA
jgi:LPXTG-motif cell wall-anchored protein